MNNAQVELAYKQLKFHGRLFQRLWVSKIPGATAHQTKGVAATYTVEDGLGKTLFSKTVNVVTQQFIRGSNDLIAFPSALQALDEHFDNACIANDGLIQMQELCGELNAYPEGMFKSDPLHGREIYHADLDELSLSNDAYINLL